MSNFRCLAYANPSNQTSLEIREQGRRRPEPRWQPRRRGCAEHDNVRGRGATCPHTPMNRRFLPTSLPKLPIRFRPEMDDQHIHLDIGTQRRIGLWGKLLASPFRYPF